MGNPSIVASRGRVPSSDYSVPAFYQSGPDDGGGAAGHPLVGPLFRDARFYAYPNHARLGDGARYSVPLKARNAKATAWC